MLSIGILAIWFTLSSILYFLLEFAIPGTYDNHRGFSSTCFLLAQGLSAFIIWGFNALY